MNCRGVIYFVRVFIVWLLFKKNKTYIFVIPIISKHAKKCAV